MKRYQYDEITESEPTVTRYKLYKAKKQWVIQGMTTVALLLGAHEAAVHGVPGLLSPSITTAKADSIDDQSQPTNTLNGDVQASQVTDQSQDTSTNTPVATIDSSSEQTTTSDQQSQADNQQTTNNQATQVENNQSKSQTTAVTKTVTKKAGQQTVTKASVSATKATVQKASTVKVKNAADFNKQATKVTKQAQKVSASVNKVVKTDAARANAKSTDKVVHNSGLDALKTHVDSEAQQVQAALKVATINNAKSLTQMQDSLTQANSLLQTMRTELDVANSMLREDKQGVDAKQVARSKQALHKLVLPEGTTAKVDEYGDLVVSTSNHAGYQAVLNQMDSMGLTKSFRNVVDPVQFYYGLKNYTDAQILSDAKLNVKSALGSLDINTDGKTITDMPFANGANVTFYNSVLPYWTKLQDAFKDGSAADIVTAASEFLGASNAVGDITTHGNFQTNSDQKQSTNHTSFALILNVDEFGNPIFTEDYNSSVKAGDLVNNRGLVVDPTDPSTDNGATLSTILLSPSGNSNLTYFTGEVGTEIANPTIKETVPNFTYTGKTDYSTGSSKLVSILGGTTPQLVINHWQSNTTPTPTVTAIKAQVGTVTKIEDGTTTFTTVPTVTLSGESGLKVPDLTISDFDWSKVQATAGTYAITLNDSGIKKITDANANTSLATSDITPGQAIIKAKTPTIVAIKATVGDVTKTEDGTTTFTDVPGVALTGEAGLKVPTLSASDFDWSKVQATAGTYSITLNDSGIKKITDANANTTLAVSDITPGQAIIKAKVPTDVAIKATVSDITKVYDGTTSFDKLPEVTLSGKSVLATPTFTAADFDWSNVKADAGTYHVTLNASGIKKITDANSNTTLVSGDVTAGTVTINKAAVKITANDSGKTQGQVDPQLTARISGKPTSGADLKYSVTRTAGETPGTYDINVTFNAADNPNYSINVTKGTFTIVAPDTILATVGNVTKVYDGTTAFPTTSLPKVTLSGTNTVMPTFTHDDFDWSKVQANAGSYQVTLNTNGLKKITDANKGAAASATNGDAIVTKAAITIKANDGTKVDGQKDPDLTATVTGQPTAGSKPVYTVTRTAGETAGTYDIIVTANATDNPNYTIQTEKGTFTITDATTNFKWTAVYVDGNGLQLATPESGANLANGASYTTSAKYIDGYYLTAQPANASGKIANGDVTVKYVYNKVGSYDIVAPNGQRTTIAYAVDHTDPTKVSIPTNQVVPYVNGYYAVGLTGKLSLVDSSNPALGYKLPAFITASLNTPIVYVAVNGGGGGGNNNNGGGGNSGGGSNTPSNNNNGNGGSNNNNNSNNTNGNTVPSGNTTPGNGGNTPTPSQPNKPTKPNKGSQSNNGSKTNGSNKGSSQKPSANGSSTPRTTTGQNGQSGFGGYTTNGVKPTRTGYPVVQGNEMTGRDQSSLKNMPVSKATTLPQTGDTNSSAISWIGVALVGLLGMFGYKRRKHS